MAGLCLVMRLLAAGCPFPPCLSAQEDSAGLACPGGMMSDDRPGAGGSLDGFSAGSRIAGYRLEKQIGQGGMAVVFRARDERLQRQVALKILSPALATDEAFRRRFVRESRSAAAVDDPHIIPVFEAGDADGVLFIAMRYVPGGDAGGCDCLRGGLSPGCGPCGRAGAP